MPYETRRFQNQDLAELAEFAKEFAIGTETDDQRSSLDDLIRAASAPLSYDDIKEDLFALWAGIAIRINRLVAIDKIIDTIVEKQSQYAVIEAATSVPWYVVAAIHSLEASLNFRTHLHNGDPLTARTVHVPAGRPVGGRPPFTWAESAIDAIRFDRLDRVPSWNVERILYTLERFNGFGYRKHHPEVKTPYLWSFSNQYTKGKYVADGRWSPDAVSRQCGAAVLLRRMIDRDIIEEIPTELEDYLRRQVEQATTEPPFDIDSSDVGEQEERFAENIDTFGSITSQDLSIDGGPRTEARPRLGLADARWPNDPANAPDTWHLPVELQNAEFDLTADVLDALLAAGHFEPDTSTNGRLVISIRGCGFADGSDSMADMTSIRLRATKPNHESFRCLIGAYDTNTRLLSLYVGSTVPRRTGMLKFYNKINFGAAGPNCNMLPTGCYEHCVGTHGGTAGAITYVLRLGDGPTSASAGPATVLRTVNDLIYGSMDMWDNTRPADNIHPAFLSSSFSSLGCLTIRGSQTPNGSHSTGSGEWKKFRQKVGFNGANHSKRFDNLLVTGHEAAAMAAALNDSSGALALVCLRQGSRGESVRKLQSQLGLNPDGVFGAGTCQELVALQRKTLGFATGTWTAKMAAMLGLNF